jgi:hypothetical protein
MGREPISYMKWLYSGSPVLGWQLVLPKITATKTFQFHNNFVSVWPNQCDASTTPLGVQGYLGKVLAKASGVCRPGNSHAAATAEQFLTAERHKVCTLAEETSQGKGRY